MDQYRCPQPPRFLYRVQYPRTQTTRHASGLRARDTTSVFEKHGYDTEFIQVVQNQFVWEYKGAGGTPFISFFSDEEHAINWACLLWRCRSSGCSLKDEWTLLTIDTALLGDTHVYKLSTLIEKMGVSIPKKAEDAHKKGAYICLHSIPDCAIKEERSGPSVRKSRRLKYPIYTPPKPTTFHDDGSDDVKTVLKGLEGLQIAI
ncbi:hypothetical protein QBC40DRAFT_272074 [Triangularia verruculosa]|uniref:DUF7587 domain-containing protein n=1 Tax=Triangularia verruculosa TaxID=2587418 RepID=A0AAN6XSL6_9PEZI|nr:hypothetical protein QBC40DRAFT_272074 [Triangularia verruculosa]